jgi:YbbR domain-containing protein
MLGYVNLNLETPLHFCYFALVVTTSIPRKLSSTMDENVISITADIDKLSYKQLQAELKKRNVSSKVCLQIRVRNIISVDVGKRQRFKTEISSECKSGER